MNAIAIILCVLVVILIAGMGYFYFKVFPKYESHWKATEYELNKVWRHVNNLEYDEDDEFWDYFYGDEKEGEK